MEKIIWVMEKERTNMLDIQRKINSHGGMRARCIVSYDALKINVEERLHKYNSQNMPSLILVDYEMVKEYTQLIPLLKTYPMIAGIPLFFLVEADADVTREEYYLQGAIVVLKRPIKEYEILRMERTAWQYETTRNYERILQRQVSELETAKKLQQLNVQLESRNDFLRKVFGKYFSDAVIEVILDKKDGEFLGGNRMDIAVLICDLRSFSARSEEMAPNEVIELLNCFFGNMVEVITKYSGIVIEFMGDGILAVFGAIVKNGNTGEKAIAAAIEMQNRMKEVNTFCKDRGNKPLEMGIGIHYGEAFVGNVGTENMMRYNVIGRVVNECSRIEGCSVGGQILASKELLQMVGCKVQYCDMVKLSAKGIGKHIDICEITGIEGAYCCCLEEYKKDSWQTPKEEVILEIYLVYNKVIVGKPLLAGLKEFCSNKASVELLQNLYEGVADSIYQLTTYQDVEVRIKKGEKYRFFQGMYAKVTSIEGRNLRLRFTTELNMLSDRDWKWGVDVIGKGKYVPENIQIVQITADEMVQMVNMAEVLQQTASLYWTKEAERVKILFVSNQKEIRALEFLDYVVENYAIVKGNETKAQAMLDTVFLQVMMSEREVDTIEALFQKIIKQYYTECQWIYAREFVRDNEELIRMLPMYCKKRVPWAYVKATNIAKEGEQICLKSLENESGIVLDISANLYIMIGYRGETYHIDKDKFESTYEISDETLDAYEMMLDYLPEVMKCENGEFVCLEDLAYLCYPKSDKTIYAKELDCRVKVFNPYNNGEYFLGRAGDYLAIREDDLEDIYIIQQEIFYDTYVKKENKVEP